MVGGLAAASFASLVALDRDNRVSLITFRAADNFTDYITNGHKFAGRHINSVLLAHAASVFLAAGVSAILWILFRPQKIKVGAYVDYESAQDKLAKYSNSSEDFFKLWPHDKKLYWSKDKSGFVAYKIQGSVVFALADPMAKDRGQLVQEFNDWCRRRRHTVCWLPVYEASKGIYEDAGLTLLQIGSSAVIDIQAYLENTSKDKWWRWRLNKSRKSGYAYQKALPPHSKGFLAQLEKISRAWLKDGGHQERGFALGHFDKTYLQRCAVHYLIDSNGHVIAFTNEVPRYGDSDTATIDMLRYLPGTDSMAYLLYSIIEDIHKDVRATRFDLGFVPFAKAAGSLLAVAKAVSADRFSAKGLEQFKNKFNPAWEPNYLAYEGDMTDLAVIALNIEKAMDR
jgi:phosphatidylglycerol lysyltransferase